MYARILILISLWIFSCQEPAFTDVEVQPDSADQLPEADLPKDSAEIPDGPEVLPPDEEVTPVEKPVDPETPVNPSNPGNPEDPDVPVVPPVEYIELDQAFATSRLDKAVIDSNLDSATLSHDFTLVRQYSDNDVRQNQVVRGPVLDSYDQGYYGFPITEDYVQTSEKKLDILAVIDNSGSMSEEQVNLATKLAPLLSSVADTDWQIGVVTTDSRDNCLRALIKKGETDAVSRFAAAVTAGTSGASSEVGVYQAKRALAGECGSGAWLRDNSTVAVLIVSDEDNCSDGTGCGNNAYKNKEYLTNFLQTKWVLGKTAKVYGLIWHPSLSQTQCPTADHKANIYADIISMTSGTWGSICDADYSATLANVSRDISETLAKEFKISYTPDNGTLKVFLDDVEQNQGFTVAGNIVSFQTPPADGTRIRFDYLYNGKPIATNYKLSKQPLNDQIEVSVDGMVVSDYTYNPATMVVSFTNPPAERSKIEIDYREYKALKTEFSAPGTIELSSIKVYVDGVQTTDFSYNPSKAVVVLPVAPDEGVEVRIVYVSKGNAVYSYPFLVNGAQPKDLELVDSQTNTKVGHLYLLGHISILPFEFVEGRTLKALYYNEAREMTEVAIPHTPIASTLYATDGTVNCAGGDITLQAAKVIVKDCGFAKNSTQIMVKYDYIAERYSEFTFNLENIPITANDIEWFVFINGTETMDYEQNVNVFTITSPLNYQDTVTIRAKYKK